MNSSQTLSEKLQKLAYERTKPFCYSCYQDAPSGKCQICASDDLMMHLAGVGVEYGFEWVIQHMVREELNPVNLEEAFEESIRECYDESIQVGWMTLDCVDIMKTMDPISWRCAQLEWEDHEANEERMMSFDNGSTYYYTHDIERLVACQE